MIAIGASVERRTSCWTAFMPILVSRAGIGIVLPVGPLRTPQSMSRKRRPKETAKNIEVRSDGS